MARITRVAKAQASKYERRCDYSGCEHESRVIQAGDAYMWFKANRYTGKRFRHADHPVWRPSEMDTTKMATAYAAQEAAHDALDNVDFSNYIGEVDDDGKREFDHQGFVDEVADILNTAGDGADETASDYQDGIDALPDNLRDTSPTAEMSQEKIDYLEEWRDELQSWQASESWDDDEERDEDEFDQAVSDFADAVLDEAREVVDNLQA